MDENYIVIFHEFYAIAGWSSRRYFSYFRDSDTVENIHTLHQAHNTIGYPTDRKMSANRTVQTKTQMFT